MAKNALKRSEKISQHQAAIARHVKELENLGMIATVKYATTERGREMQRQETANLTL